MLTSSAPFLDAEAQKSHFGAPESNSEAVFDERFAPHRRIFWAKMENLQGIFKESSLHQPQEARKGAKMIRFLHRAYQNDQKTIPDDTEAEQRPFTGD